MDFFWEKEGWESRDRHFKQLDSMPFRRPIPFIPRENGLYIIRGPRQVGKSCWLKQVLSYYAKTERCFYLSCEELTDHRELGTLLESVSDRKVVLLDEISFVPNWDRAIKHAIDSGKTQILIITGSHAHDLKLGSDRMPGRFDAGGEFELLPMDFFEFQEMRKLAGWTSETRVLELENFFRVGGFPKAIAEGGPEGITPKSAMKDYWKWLVGDVVKLGRQELYLTEILIQIVKTLQTPISLQNIAVKTAIGSHNTVQEYLSILESCFAARTLFAIDPNTGSLQTRKNRKIYFSDPLLYWIALEKAGIDRPKNAFSGLAELVANEFLFRHQKRFGFLSTANGEIDFYKSKTWALEVKWAPVANDISKLYHNQTLPWKKVWTQNNFLLELPPEF